MKETGKQQKRCKISLIFKFYQSRQERGALSSNDIIMKARGIRVTEEVTERVVEKVTEKVTDMYICIICFAKK